MLRRISKLWHDVVKLKVSQDFTNIYALHRRFNAIKNISNSIIFYIVNLKNLKIKEIKVFKSIYSFSYLPVLLFFFFLSIILFLI